MGPPSGLFAVDREETQETEIKYIYLAASSYNMLHIHEEKSRDSKSVEDRNN